MNHILFCLAEFISATSNLWGSETSSERHATSDQVPLWMVRRRI